MARHRRTDLAGRRWAAPLRRLNVHDRLWHHAGFTVARWQGQRGLAGSFCGGGLAAAEGARLVILDVLPPAEARQMFASKLGPERAELEPEAGTEITELCARLDGRPQSENPARLQFALVERAVREPLAPRGVPGRDKIPDQRAELPILRSVFGGRCWVRTNVG
jgi:hypothetical protein